MDANTIFVKSVKAGRIGMLWGGGLSSQSKHILSLVDGRLSVDQLLHLSEKLTKNELQKILLELEKDGYIHRLTQHETEPAWLHDVNAYSIAVEEIDAADFNFSDTAFSPAANNNTKKSTSQPTPPSAQQSHASDEIAAKVKREAERKAKAEAAEKVRREAEEHAKRIAEAEAKARQEMERVAREKAEAVAKAHAEELARQKAEAERKTQAEAEARAHAAAEQKARLQAERIAREQAEAIAKAQEAARLEAERKAKLEAEERVRAEAELKAQAEAAEQARLAAEQRAREEAEARARIEVERQAQEALAEKARHEVEEKARLEAERMAHELAEAKAKAEAEEQARLQAERKAKEAAEQARLDAERLAREQAETLARMEAERKAQEALVEKARQEAEEKARLEAEHMARELAEAKAKAEAEEQARLEAERRAQEVAEQAKSEAERLAREQAETLARMEAERKVQEELAAKARQEAETQARLDAERMEREKAEAIIKATAEAEQKARLSEEARLKEEASHSATAAAEARAVIDVSEQARLEAERIAREDADEKAWQEAERLEREKADTFAATTLDEENEQARVQAERKALAEAAEQAMHKVENLTREDVEAVREELQRVATQEKKAKTRFSIKEHFSGRLTTGRLMSNKWIVKSMKALPIMVPATLVLLVVLVHFVNLGMLIKPIERLASDSVGEPVTVREVHAALFPRPKLVLADVSVGDTAAVKIGAVHIVSGISMLFDDVKSLESIEISNVTLQPADVGRQMQWVNHAAKADKLKIGQITLKEISFQISGLELEPFDGKLIRTASGELSKIELVNASRNLTLLLVPQSGSCDLTLTASGWQPQQLKPLELDEITATGRISQYQASFNQIEAKAYGGTIKAQGVLDWSGRLHLSGNLELVKATLPRLLAAFGSGASVDGKLNIKAAFASNADQPLALVHDVEINANFEVQNGRLNGVALSHAVMSGPASKPLPEADFTRFDTLAGNLQFKDGLYRYRELELRTDQFRARGLLDIMPDQMLTGKISAELMSKTLRRQASFNVSGTSADIRLQ